MRNKTFVAEVRVGGGNGSPGNRRDRRAFRKEHVKSSMRGGMVIHPFRFLGGMLRLMARHPWAFSTLTSMLLIRLWAVYDLWIVESFSNSQVKNILASADEQQPLSDVINKLPLLFNFSLYECRVKSNCEQVSLQDIFDYWEQATGLPFDSKQKRLFAPYIEEWSQKKLKKPFYRPIKHWLASLKKQSAMVSPDRTYLSEEDEQAVMSIVYDVVNRLEKQVPVVSVEGMPTKNIYLRVAIYYQHAQQLLQVLSLQLAQICYTASLQLRGGLAQLKAAHPEYHITHFHFNDGRECVYVGEDIFPIRVTKTGRLVPDVDVLVNLKNHAVIIEDPMGAQILHHISAYFSLFREEDVQRFAGFFDVGMDDFEKRAVNLVDQIKKPPLKKKLKKSVGLMKEHVIETEKTWPEELIQALVKAGYLEKQEPEAQEENNSAVDAEPEILPVEAQGSSFVERVTLMVSAFFSQSDHTNQALLEESDDEDDCVYDEEGQVIAIRV